MTVTRSTPDDPGAPGRRAALSPQERDTFLAATARHRRASWRVTVACAIAVAVLALVVAILMAPLIYCIIGIGFDVANLVTPTEDLLGRIGREIDVLSSAPRVPLERALRLAAIAAAPGLVLMATGATALARAWRHSPLFNGGEVGGRAADRSVLAEERLTNIVEEMSIAAGIPVPQVVIVPGGLNAAACGRDAAHATLIVGDALPAGVEREQLEGLIAHLVGSIVNGDMAIGLRVTTTLSLFGLTARVGTGWGDRGALYDTLKLFRVIVAPTSAGTLRLLNAIADPFARGETTSSSRERPGGRSAELTWRDWLLMTIMGPLVLSGFLAGLVTAFFLQPLIALAWRQRKYMADATAVQLTRDPDGLASALATIADMPAGITPWTAHLAVAADRTGRSGPFNASVVPIFPSVEKRVAALDRMGAHVALAPKRRMSWPMLLLLWAAGIVVFVLMSVVVYLLVILSAAMSGLFTIVPAALLHAILRWLASLRA